MPEEFASGKSLEHPYLSGWHQPVKTASPKLHSHRSLWGVHMH